jgi:hypothetical protein
MRMEAVSDFGIQREVFFLAKKRKEPSGRECANYKKPRVEDDSRLKTQREVDVRLHLKAE